ncbi:MAG: UPF0262 family protein [Myxococcota bacterium]
MVLKEVRIDPRTRAEADEARRAEWDGCIAELLTPGRCVFAEGAHRLDITMTEQAFLLDLLDADENRIEHVRVPRDTLKDLIAEYVDVVRDLARQEGPGGLARFEALDMAKKVVHDRAARVLRRQCRALGIDHDTARRLFTLLLSLRVDTTKLVGIHGHRRVK